ncbi:MAG: response regulator [Salibacteraceae bacterium]
MKKNQTTIVIVDDDQEDVFTLRRAFGKENPNLNITHLSDGFMAKDYFSGGHTKSRADSANTEIVLLDINMPGMNGFDVLAYLRNRKDGHNMPIVMLTTSSNKDDISKAYALGANAYMVKPASLDGMQNLAKTFEAFWVSTAQIAQ